MKARELPVAGTETELKFLLTCDAECIEREAIIAGRVVSRRLVQQRYLDPADWKLRAKTKKIPGGIAYKLCLRDSKRRRIAVSIDQSTWALLTREAEPAPVRDGDLPGTERLKIDDLSAWTIRFRRTSALSGTDIRCFITLKRKRTVKTSIEIETRISAADHDAAIVHCGPAIRKRRLVLRHREHLWEIDTFLNPELEGLELAEVELSSEDVSPAKPKWAGEDVTADKRFRNAALARKLAT